MFRYMLKHRSIVTKYFTYVDYIRSVKVYTKVSIIFLSLHPQAMASLVISWLLRSAVIATPEVSRHVPVLRCTAVRMHDIAAARHIPKIANHKHLDIWQA